LGFRVWGKVGLGFRVMGQGLKFGSKELGVRVQVLEFRVKSFRAKWV